MKSSAKALVVYNNQLLLFLRDNDPDITDPNKWNFLGGTIEENEKPLDALKRELKEEANIDATDITYIGELDTWNGKNYMYIVKIDESIKNTMKLGDEGQELRFFTYEDLKNVQLGKNLGDFVQKYGNQIRSLLNEKILFRL